MEENGDKYSNELDSELRFSYSKSSGPGGQHVNKVNTKAELFFDIKKSLVLNEDEKALILDKLSNKINNEGVLVLVSQETRSQHRNKNITIERFYELINKALIPEKKRKKTKISKQANEKRLKDKKAISEKKERRKPEI